MGETNSVEDAELVVQKIGSDVGIHRNPRKGTLKAPEEILEDYDFDKDVLVSEVFVDEFDLENTHRRIEDNTNDFVGEDTPILSIGGDHSISYPIIMALKRMNPDMKLVWLDAHLDLKEKVDRHVSHDVVVRELVGRGFAEEDIYIVGATRIDEDEEEFLEESELNIYRSDEVEDFLREFETSEQPVYLSVDIDVLKEEEAPGTGYPDGDLSLEKVNEIIDAVEPFSADLVEVAPPFDEDGKTVENAKKIVSWLEESLDR